MHNRVELIGFLGADPEVRTFTNGGKVANLRLATSEKWKDRTTGEAREKTEWHSISVTADGLVGVVERYLKKGARVYISGKLQTRKWQDQSGQDRYSTEVVVAGFAGKCLMLNDRPNGGDDGGYRQQGSAPPPGGNIPPGGSDMDDEIPF